MYKFLFILTLLPNIAFAHSFYAAECCSNNDCRPVLSNEVEELSNGAWRYQDIFFTKAMVRPSEDNQFHVCYTTVRRPLCIYVLQSM